MVAAVLPVELTSFNAQLKATTTLLTWTTVTEKNNKGFEIQRAVHNLEWQTIGFVQGHGTTQEAQNYTYTDEAPINGTNYYCLKQVDFDGQFEYSMVESMDIVVEAAQLSVFPNPVTDELNIIDGEGQATIPSILGQPVKQFAVSSGQFTVNTSDLPKGQYILHIQTQYGNVMTKQFTK